MAGIFHPETIEGTELNVESLQQSKTRTGYVDNLDISGDADPIVLEKCMAASGFPALSSLHPSYLSSTGMLLRRIRLVPDGGNIVRVFMYYETPIGGGTPTTYIITDDAFTSQVERNTVPGTRTPIRCSYIGHRTVYAADGTPSQKPYNIPDDFVTMRFFQPCRVVSVSGLSYGAVPSTKRQYVGYCNQETWLGLEKGYWMMQRYRTSLSKYSGYYTYEAVAATRGFEDWSECGILKSAETGKYAEVDDTKVTEMNNLPYTRGIIYPPPGNLPSYRNGLVRVGGNPTTSFAALFGFSTEP